MAKRFKSTPESTDGVEQWDPSDLCEVSIPHLIDAVKDEGCYSYDLETTGLSPRNHRIEGVAFYVPNEKRPDRKPIRAWFPFTDGTMDYTVNGEVIPLREPIDQVKTMSALRELWSLKNVIAVRANGIFDDAFLYCASGLDEPIVVDNIIADSMLADYVADERRKRYGLKLRVEEVFGHKMTTYSEAAGGQASFGFAQKKPLGVYSADDTQWTYRLWKWAINNMRQQDPPREHKDSWCSPMDSTPGIYSDLEKVYWQIEMKIQRILMEMEITGCFIDWEWLVKVQQRLEKEKQDILVEIKEKSGWVPNLRSPKQVSDFLYKTVEQGGQGVPTDGVDYNEKLDQYETGDKAIKHHAPRFPLVSKLLKYRSLGVLESSFCQKLIGIAQEEGRVYARFRQTGTVIARLSCIANGTLIDVVRDLSKNPDGIPIEDVRPGDLAYTYDDALKLTLRPVKKSWKTGNRNVVRVHWKGSGHRHTGYVDMTPEHPVRLIDGSYRKASELFAGDRCLALSRNVTSYPYSHLYPTGQPEIGAEHRWIYETINGSVEDKHVHHRDGNKLNNLLCNLTPLTHSDHTGGHVKEMWTRPKVREAIQTQLLHRSDGTLITREHVAKAREMTNQREAQAFLGVNFYKFKTLQEYFGFDPTYNHVITRIEVLSDAVDVYDLEIEGTHNFIAGGLDVHNSADPVNLMNQPRDKNLIRKSFCAHLEDDYDPARLELCLIDADYVQMELRMAAHLANEPNMVEVFRNITGCANGENGQPCERYLYYECKTCDECSLPTIKNEMSVCGKCHSPDIKHQNRCRHVDLHQRTSEDVKIPRNPLAKCLDGSTLVLATAGCDAMRPREIESLIGAIPTGEHHELSELIFVDRGTGNQQYAHAPTAIRRHDRRTKIVVTKRAVVIATDDHRFQVLGDFNSLDPATPSYVHTAGRSLVEAQNLTRGMKLPFVDMAHERAMEPTWHQHANYGVLTINPLTKEVQADGPATIKLDEKWAYFAGMFAGDGCASGNSCSISHGHTAEYQEWRDVVKDACNAVGLPTAVRDDLLQTAIGSRVVRRYLSVLRICEELGEGEKGAKIMRVPPWVLSGGPKMMWSYIAGIFDTDGTAGKKTNGTASFTTKSPEFAGQMAFMLRWLGMPVLVKPGFNKTYECWYYTVHILGEGLGRFAQYCPMRYREKVARLRERAATIKLKCAPSDDEVLAIIDGGSRTVYDFQISTEDHLYNQGGLVGHNNANFGLLYRMGAPKFCIYASLFDEAGHPRLEYGEELIAKWHAAYPGIATWHERVIHGLLKDNYVAYSIARRRRRLDVEYKKNDFRAGTQAIQFKVSGSCQEIIKLAMIKIYEERNRRIANSRPAESALWKKFKFMIQVHDELLFESPKAMKAELMALVKNSMETAVVGLRVPFTADVRSGRNWEEAH